MTTKIDFGTIFIKKVAEQEDDEITIHGDAYAISDLAPDLRSHKIDPKKLALGDAAELERAYDLLKKTRHISPFNHAVQTYNDQFYNEARRSTLKALGVIAGMTAMGGGGYMAGDAIRKICKDKEQSMGEHEPQLVGGVGLLMAGTAATAVSLTPGEESKFIRVEKEKRDEKYVARVIAAFATGLQHNRDFANERKLGIVEYSLEPEQQHASR